MIHNTFSQILHVVILLYFLIGKNDLKWLMETRLVLLIAELIKIIIK